MEGTGHSPIPKASAKSFNQHTYYSVLYVILFLNIKQVVIQCLLAGPVMNSSDIVGMCQE